VRELTAANRRLRAAARAKTEFMQNLSHELATPLTPITGYLKILQSGKMGTLSEEQKRIHEPIGLATDRLARTLDNLVNFATLEGGGHAVHRESFDLQALLKSVLKEERLKARSSRIHLDVKGETLKQGWGDDRKLRQALSRLVDNAIKFGPRGSEILVRVSGDPTHLLFEGVRPGRRPLARREREGVRPLLSTPTGSAMSAHRVRGSASPSRSSRLTAGTSGSRARPRTSPKGRTTFPGPGWHSGSRCEEGPGRLLRKSRRASDSRRPA